LSIRYANGNDAMMPQMHRANRTARAATENLAPTVGATLPEKLNIGTAR